MLSATTILITAIGIFVIGAIFLRRGIWPRRVGDTPYCRRCNYNLTGIESDRCPECGGDISPATIVRGQRSRRPGLIVAGCLCLLPLLFVAGASMTKVDWYRYKPTGWVISDLNTTNMGKWQKAWTELDRRIRLGVVSPEHESRLIDICLIEQGKHGVAFGRTDESVDFLGDAYLRGVLSDVQAEKFFNQLIQAKLRVREKIIAGANIAYNITKRSRCPSSWWIDVKEGDLFINGNRARGSGGGSTLRGANGGASSRGSFGYALDSGTHTFTVSLLVAVYVGVHGDEDHSTLKHRREIKLDAAFEVLANEPPDYVTMVDDPTLRDELFGCFEPRQFRFYPRPHGGVIGEIVASPTPVNVAFDIIARVGEREFEFGQIVSKKNQQQGQYILQFGWRDGLSAGDTFDIVLRSSEELVHNSVDLYEAWEGCRGAPENQPGVGASNPASVG